MRLFERHPNGSIIDVKGWRRKTVIATWAAWHRYQDNNKQPQRQVGFVKEEDNGGTGSNGTAGIGGGPGSGGISGLDTSVPASWYGARVIGEGQ